MNRQTKRAMQRRQQATDRADMARRQRQMVEGGKKQRTGIRQFLREVRGELKKVNWPSRREMLTYTVVVLVTVVVVTSFVFGLDFVIARGIFRVFGLS